jgi:hypothetical protein
MAPFYMKIRILAYTGFLVLNLLYLFHHVAMEASKSQFDSFGLAKSFNFEFPVVRKFYFKQSVCAVIMSFSCNIIKN